MSVSKTWPGGGPGASPESYEFPTNDEVNWASLTNFFVAIANGAQATTFQKFGTRKALVSPVVISAASDCVIVCDMTTPGPVAVTLPAGANKQLFLIVDGKGDAGTNNITITAGAGDTVAGAASVVLNTSREAIWLIYSSIDTDWKILGRMTGVVGLSNPMTTTGDIIVGGASGTPTRMATGAAGTFLKGGATPSWSALARSDMGDLLPITAADIAAAAVTTTKIADAAVTTLKIADGAVTGPKLGTTSVGTTNIIDGSVSNVKLADGAVTDAKVTGPLAGSKVTADFTGQTVKVGQIGAATGTFPGVPIVGNETGNIPATGMIGETFAGGASLALTTANTYYTIASISVGKGVWAATTTFTLNLSNAGGVLIVSNCFMDYGTVESTGLAGANYTIIGGWYQAGTSQMWFNGSKTRLFQLNAPNAIKLRMNCTATGGTGYVTYCITRIA